MKPLQSTLKNLPLLAQIPDDSNGLKKPFWLTLKRLPLLALPFSLSAPKRCRKIGGRKLSMEVARLERGLKSSSTKSRCERTCIK